MDLSQTISAIKDVVLAVAGGVTAAVAVKGINKWRQELSGKAGFEAARALAKATYHLRDQLHACRSPLITGNEYPQEYSADWNSSGEGRARLFGYVFKNRWVPVAKAIAEFDVQALEAEVLWGEAIREKTGALRSCVSELFVAIEAVLEDMESGGKEFAADKDFEKRMRNTVYGTSTSKDNQLSQKIATAVIGIEDELKKHLGRS